MNIGLNAGLGRNATLNDLVTQIEKAEADIQKERQEIERLFVEESDLFDLANESQLIRDMITAEGCPPGSIVHPAKVYRLKS